jgi:hypothetical protein
MQTVVEFRSDLFSAYEASEENINPGIYGKRLAEFLQRGLGAMGFAVSRIFDEDWGWVVSIEGGDVWIGCGHYPEYPDGFLCFV